MDLFIIIIFTRICT